MKSEAFISVDVEAAGPIPGDYALLSIGACNIYGTETFTCTLKPTSMKFVPEALKVSRLSLQDLSISGRDPKQAMLDFKEWVGIVAAGATPVFVGFNAGFDWSFVNYYFHHFLGENPFGFAPLDIKAFYMGTVDASWGDTRSSIIAKALKPTAVADHNALHDAIYQAELFRLIRQSRKTR